PARRLLTGHDRAGMRPVRNSEPMQRDRSPLDSTPRPELAAHIKQNFIRLDVVVHPRDLYRFGMRIEQPRRERADDITTDLECLMNRRRLVHGAGDRLEILGVKSEWVNVSIPANDIERMMRHRHDGPAWAVLH